VGGTGHAEPAGRWRRLPGMAPKPTVSRSLAGALLVLTVMTAACAGSPVPPSAAASGPVSPGPTAGAGFATPPAVEPTPVPGATGATGATGDPDGSAGGGSAGGSPGSGVLLPVNPGTGGGVPANPEPTMVTPTTGLTGVHEVPAAKLEASVSGRDVAVRVAWWSGVEPCNALAGITVARDGGTFVMTVHEGSAAAPDMMCIEIAVYKAAVVDLGELEPGTYTITAFGDPAPVEVSVAG